MVEGGMYEGKYDPMPMHHTMKM